MPPSSNSTTSKSAADHPIMRDGPISFRRRPSVRGSSSVTYITLRYRRERSLVWRSHDQNAKTFNCMLLMLVQSFSLWRNHAYFIGDLYHPTLPLPDLRRGSGSSGK